MHAGKLVFTQLLELAPWHTFRRLVAKYRGDFNVRRISCLDQFLCMAFAQLTYLESLRDIEACHRAQPEKLSHMGIRGNVSRSALADANEPRVWRIYFEFAQSLIKLTRELYANESLGIELKETVYAVDSATMDLCLPMFEWALFRQTKAAVKLHTLLDLRGSIPTFIHISDGTLHDVNVLDLIEPEPAVGTYVLVAIIRKRLNLPLSLHTMLQILSVTPFEKQSLLQLLREAEALESTENSANQLTLL